MRVLKWIMKLADNVISLAHAAGLTHVKKAIDVDSLSYIIKNI